jgi:hypothetical protein
VLRALRCVQLHKVAAVPPELFLEAAASAGDVGLFVATYRFVAKNAVACMPDLDAVAAQYGVTF